MIAIRNSVKALIIQDGRLLCVKQRARDTGEVFYTLPGGGQEGGETFEDALRRECLEELGAQIDIGPLVLVREYIGKHHAFAYKHAHCHQIEFMFRCALRTPIDLRNATGIDPEQVGYEWIECAALGAHNVYPKALRNALDAAGKVVTPIYLGDVN